ncbi:LacI family DNA-binding transcriptional regulator [Cellulomonas carbonis]|uniref:Transcriptional regulator n=1 Tax=Cellulomonas carbonis T26 TaxID=947969 RepID=A0A0A0BXA9_9CELL|nr:LacI family DNA-binding transcriptional regulator [Cellulomonas carbonis]KGM12561.1 transcriptional regulator [Cellulomonas carbonis T26]GGB93449.1 alanine racemase [Cellulomonas carbonis]
MDARPTLQSVAERAAVSRQTVSNVLNAPHLVRPETLERVRQVIEEVGYRPHSAARQMRTRRSRVIGLRLQPTVDGINGAVLDQFLHALTEHAQVRGYRVMLFTAPDDEGEIAQYGELLDTLELDAFVLTSTHHGDPRTRWLADHEVPFVTFGRPWDPPATDGRSHAWVDVDGATGTRAAVEHLQELGHRRIAFVGWPEGSDTGDDRRRGWRRAVLASGVAAHELAAWDVGVPDSVADGADAAATLLDGPEDAAPTAFVCASDSLALGVLAATRRDAADPSVAVVGFDDTPVARAVGLTSVAQPLTEAAVRALQLLLDQLGPSPRPATDDHHVLLSPSLAVRASSVPAP